MNNNIIEANTSGQRALPACDVFESDESFLIVADVPGLSSESLKLRLDQRELHLQGSGQATQQYARSFRVPVNVDVAAIRAEINHGVVHITMPKLEKLAREIPVTSAS